MRSSFVKKLFHYSGIELISKGLNWLLMFILPFFLPLAEYGQIGLFIAIEGIISLILLCGQEKAILKDAEKSDDQVFFTAVVLVCIAAVSLSIISFALWALGIFIFPIKLLIVFQAGLFFNSLIRLLMVKFRTSGSVKDYSLIRFIAQLSKFLACIIIAYLLHSAASYLYSLLISGVLVCLYYFSRFNGFLNNTATLKKRLVEQFRFGWPFIFNSISGSLTIYLDRFLISGFLDSRSLGIYTLIYSVGSGLTFLYVAVSSYLEPLVYKFSSEVAQYKKLLGSYKYGLTASAIIFSIIISLLFPYYAHRLKDFNDVDSSNIYLMLMAFAINPFYFSLSYELTVLNKTSHIAYSTFLTALLNLVLNFLLIKALGFQGSILAKFISYNFQGIILYFLGRKLLQNARVELLYLFVFFLLNIGLFILKMPIVLFYISGLIFTALAIKIIYNRQYYKIDFTRIH